MITGAQLSAFLQRRLPRIVPFICDLEYRLPSKDWIENDFSKSFRDKLKRDGLDVYRKDANDCDKFGFRAFSFARDCNAEMEGNRGISVGAIFYLVGAVEGEGHDINIWVTRESEDAELELLFWEPQTQQWVTLTQDEEDSIWFELI